ncbi:MAG: Ig-like domain-containing protein [Pirellulaceae bacterium]|nr:Ig-like domain-containing protein [Pirellulaceae bacterium]
MYVAEDGVSSGGVTAGIHKYSLVGGNWTARGSVALATTRGLTATVSSTSVTLYVTNGSSFQTLTDSTGYNATISGTLTSLATAATNTAFRGVAFVPTNPRVVSINRSTTSPSNAATVDFTVTFNRSVVGVDTTDFAPAMSGGVTGATVASVTSGSTGASRIVTVNTGTGNGMLGLNLTDDDSVTDLNFVPLGGTGTGNGNFTTGQTYTIDKTAPTVTIDQASGQSDPTAISPINFTVIFSENTTNFTDSDVSFTGSTVGGTLAAAVTGSGSSYNVAVTGMTGTGTVVASLAAGVATDAAGNGNLASTSGDNSVTVGAAGLTVTIDQASGQADPTNGATINYTAIFSAPVTNFVTGDVSFTGSSAGGTLLGTVTGGPQTYNIAVTGMTSSGSVVATIAAGVATDAGSTSNSVSTSTDNTVSFDNLAPTVTINQASGQSDPTSGATINYTVVFSENTTNFVTGDVSFPGSTAGGTLVGTVTGSGSSYNVAVTGMTTSGTVIPSLAAGIATDAAGNGNTASTSGDNTVNYDVTVPTVSSINRTDGSPSEAASVSFTVTFSESVAGVDATDFALVSTVNNPRIASVSGSGTTWTVVVNSGWGIGNLGLNLVDNDTIADGAGNVLAGFGTSGPTDGSFTGQVYAMLSRAIVGSFAPGNLLIYRVGDGSGTLTNAATAVFLDEYTPAGALVRSVPLPTSDSGLQQTLTAAGTSTSEGLLTLSTDGRYAVATGYDAALATASLSSTTSASVPRVIGRIAFDGSIDTTTALTDTSSSTNFRSAITNNGVDFWAAGGAGGVRYTTLGSTTTSTQVNSTGATNLRQINIFDGQLYISTNSGTNGRIGAVGTSIPNTTGHSIASLPGIPTTGEVFGFFFADLSAGIAGLDTLYVASEDAAAVTKYTFDGTTWNATGTVGVNADDYRGITGVASSGIVSLYATRGGNQLVSIVDSSSYGGTLTATPSLLNTTAANTALRGIALAPVNPQVLSILRATASPTATSSVQFNVTFNNSVTGVDTGDFSLASGAAPGATIASVTGSGATYVVTVNGITASGTVGLNLIDNDSIVDAAGNRLGSNSPGNGDFVGQVYTINQTSVPVTINQASGQADPTNGSTINYTVVFASAVTGFIGTDVSFTGSTVGGTLAAVVTGGPATYNVAVTGMTGTGTVVASLASGVATDGSSNPNSASTSTDNSVAYDGVAPTVTINQASGQADPTNGSTINFTVLFSESVTGFASGDVSFTGSTVGGTLAAVVTGGPATYNVAVSGMTGSGTVVATIPAGAATDAASNSSTAATFTDNTVTFDGVAPTVTINQASGQADPTNGSTINFTVLFSEPTTNFATGDVTLSGTAGATTAVVTGSGTSYNVAVSGMSASGTVIASIGAGVATDAVGNGNTASTSTDNSVTFNAPTFSVTINQASGQVDPATTSPINFTVLFSEPTTNFATGDVTLSGTAGATTAVVTGSGTSYNVAVSGMSASGTVIASIGAGVATDGSSNPNTPSTSTDNTVNFVIGGGLLYVDDTWAGTGGGANPAFNPVGVLSFGTNAFADLPSAIAAATTGSTIVVFGGSYPAAVDINKSLAPFQLSVNTTVPGDTTVTIGGAVTLTSDVALVAAGVASGTPADLVFGSTINSGPAPRALAVDLTSTRDVTFSGNVGATGNLAALSITNASDVTFSGTLTTIVGGGVTQASGTGLTTFGGAGTSAIGGALSIKTANIAVNAGTIAVAGAAGTIFELLGGAATQSLATALTGGLLSLKGTGGFTLTSSLNDFANLTANTNGAISYTDANSLNITAAGIHTVDDNVTITTGSTLAIGGIIDVDTANLTLNGGAAVTQSAAIRGNLLNLPGAGPYTLTTTTNAFTSLQGNVAGAVSYTDGSDFALLNLSAASLLIGTADVAAGTQNLSVAAGAVVTSTSGPITLNAGDNLTILAGASVTSFAALNLNGDTGAAVDAAGSTMVLGGTLSAGTVPISITGNTGNDTIQIDGNAGTGTDGGTVQGVLVTALVNGGGGDDALVLDNTGDATGRSIVVSPVNAATSDRYAVQGINSAAGNDFEFRNINVLTVTAGTGIDNFDARLLPTTPIHDLNTITLNGWTGADNFFLFTSDQRGGAGGDAISTLTPTSAASGITAINLNGDAPNNPNPLDGNDTFGALFPSTIPGSSLATSVRALRPSASTAIAVNGNLPTAGSLPPGDTIGDSINIDISAFPNTVPVVLGMLASTGRVTLVTSGSASFGYTQIEDLNLADGGRVSAVQAGGIYARGTIGTDVLSVQGTANPNVPLVRVNSYSNSFIVSSPVVFHAGTGNDTLSVVGTYNLPVLYYGGDGDDTISGGGGGDKLVGGAGRDRINAYGGNNEVWGDRDPVDAGVPDTAANRALLASDVSTFHPAALGYNDIISTGDGADIVYAGPGDDGSTASVISLGGGDDVFYGGAGNDTVAGGGENDRLYGGAGNDRLIGDDGNDLLAGNDGNDSLLGKTGHDVLIGGAGSDVEQGDDGNDVLFDGSLTLTGPDPGNDSSQVAGDTNDRALQDLLIDWTVNVPFALGQIVAAFTDDHAGTDQLSGGDQNDAFSDSSPSERLDFGFGGDTLLP